jgi:long-chain fatty acid transport protein
LGAANGAGFGWQDVTVLKLGVSQRMSNTLVVRGGLSHNNQPIPTSQTFFNILAPGVVQNSLTLGATWTLADKSEITVGYMHAFKQTVNGAGSISPLQGGGNANLSMSEDSLGVSYGW